MAIFAKLKADGTEIGGAAIRVTAAAGEGLTVPDLNGSVVINTFRAGQKVDVFHSGARTFNPIALSKPIEPGSVLFFRAFCTNETVEGDFYLTRLAKGASGTTEEVYLIVNITGGKILDWSQSESREGGGTESLSLCFETCTFTYKGNLEHKINWPVRSA